VSLGQTPSWSLKIRRAEAHLAELQQLVDGYLARHHYRPQLVPPPPADEPTHWQFLLKITQEPNPRIAIVLGDFLFNVRSALDHIAVAVAPRERQMSASFPILSEPLDDKKKKDFQSRTRDMPGEAIEIIDDEQPYNMRVRNPRAGPLSMDPLDALSRLQNADKHRTLAVLTAGLTHPFVKISWRTEAIGQLTPIYVSANEEIVAHQDIGNRIPYDQVTCEVQGIPKLSVFVGNREEEFELATVTRGIIERVRNKIIPRLEPFTTMQ
jgi:hypothetical protein